MKDECCHGHPDNGELATQTESQRAETDLRDINTALLEALEAILRYVDGWCCPDDSGNPTIRFAGISREARAAIEAAKGDA